MPGAGGRFKIDQHNMRLRHQRRCGLRHERMSTALGYVCTTKSSADVIPSDFRLENKHSPKYLHVSQRI